MLNFYVTFSHNQGIYRCARSTRVNFNDSTQATRRSTYVLTDACLLWTPIKLEGSKNGHETSVSYVKGYDRCVNVCLYILNISRLTPIHTSIV